MRAGSLPVAAPMRFARPRLTVCNSAYASLEPVEFQICRRAVSSLQNLGQRVHRDRAIDGLQFARQRHVKPCHRAQEFGPRAAAGRHDQAEQRAQGLLRSGFLGHDTLHDVHVDPHLVIGHESFQALDDPDQLNSYWTLRVHARLERTVVALVETECGPEWQLGRMRIEETKIARIEEQIEDFAPAIRELEAVADAQRTHGAIMARRAPLGQRLLQLTSR